MDFKERLKQEYTDLDDRICKLTAFLQGNPTSVVNSKQYVLLQHQLDSMRTYRYFLSERMKNLKIYT